MGKPLKTNELYVRTAKAIKAYAAELHEVVENRPMTVPHKWPSVAFPPLVFAVLDRFATSSSSIVERIGLMMLLSMSVFDTFQ